MKLLIKPKKNTDFIRNGIVTLYQCTILVPDEHNDTEKNMMWNKLKYGKTVDLWINKTEDLIDFPEDGVTLYGVTPTHMERSKIWNGRVFDCRVDYFEEYQ